MRTGVLNVIISLSAGRQTGLLAETTSLCISNPVWSQKHANDFQTFSLHSPNSCLSSYISRDSQTCSVNSTVPLALKFFVWCFGFFSVKDLSSSLSGIRGLSTPRPQATEKGKKYLYNYNAITPLWITLLSKEV